MENFLFNAYQHDPNPIYGGAFSSHINFNFIGKDMVQNALFRPDTMQ